MKIRILFGRERKGPSSEGEGSTPSLLGNLAPKGHLLMMVAIPRQREGHTSSHKWFYDSDRTEFILLFVDLFSAVVLNCLPGR